MRFYALWGKGLVQEGRLGRITGKPEIMPDCGTDLSRIAGNFRLADNPETTR
jgi:hypothetical protein